MQKGTGEVEHLASKHFLLKNIRRDGAIITL